MTDTPQAPEPDAEALALANAPTHRPLFNRPVGHPMLPGGVRHVTVCMRCGEEWPCSVDALRAKLTEAAAKLAQAEARIKELEAAQGHGCGGHFTYD